MIELLGVRYGVGWRTVAATVSLVATIGLSYALFVLRFALRWFGVQSPQVLASTESGCVAFAMASVLIATAILCSLACAAKAPLTKVDTAEAPVLRPRWRLVSEATAWLDVTPAFMGLAICVSVQFLEWRDGLLVDVLICPIVAMMAFHVRTLWRVTKRMRAEDGADRMMGGDRLAAFDEMRFMARLAGSRWKFPDAIDDPAEADQCAQRARRSRRGWTTMTAASASFLVVVSLAGLVASVEALARGLNPADLPQFADSSFLQMCGAPAGGVIILSFAAACQARATETSTLTALYTERSKLLKR